MARLLVVHHSPSRSMTALTEAVLAGASDDAIEGVEVVDRPALETTADDVLAADGVLLGTPANFGYMSGALKHFFDSTFLQVGGSLADDGGAAEGGSAERTIPFGLYVHGRYDTTGAVRAVMSITGALPWRQAAEVLDVLGDISDDDREGAYELGGTLAALLMD
ncbi:flavodoxin family protein [Mobilicoccus massiliensis]|uniref:flavodoxin family protein n=1 Tax=Mobilicoccus massiliensis TaxID=1522310 RepID=UPI00058C4751|nr:NAD(P)H-dependent oxidoreductase [Mobilicoccus massiliensis]